MRRPAYLHDTYVDYRFLGPDSEATARVFADEHGGTLVPYESKPLNVVRIDGALLK